MVFSFKKIPVDQEAPPSRTFISLFSLRFSVFVTRHSSCSQHSTELYSRFKVAIIQTKI